MPRPQTDQGSNHCPQVTKGLNFPLPHPFPSMSLGDGGVPSVPPDPGLECGEASARTKQAPRRVGGTRWGLRGPAHPLAQGGAYMPRPTVHLASWSHVSEGHPRACYPIHRWRSLYLALAMPLGPVPS